MGNIYWQATQVLSWLGTNLQTSWFLRVIRENPGISHAETVTNIDGSQSSVKALARAYFANEYWKRAWITQEVGRARKVIVVSDREELEFHRVTEESPLSQYLPNRDLKRQKLVNLIIRFRNRLCSNKRDRIYSLAALCSEKITVDYNLSKEQVLEQTLKSCQDSLCLCTIYVIQEALELDLEDLSTSTRTVAECQLRTTSKHNRDCDDYYPGGPCPSTLKGLYFCMSSVCNRIAEHLFLRESATQAGVIEAYVTRRYSDSMDFNYLGTDVSVEEDEMKNFYHVRLSLRALVMISCQIGSSSNIKDSHRQRFGLRDGLASSTSFVGRQGKLSMEEWLGRRRNWNERADSEAWSEYMNWLGDKF